MRVNCQTIWGLILVNDRCMSGVSYTYDVDILTETLLGTTKKSCFFELQITYFSPKTGLGQWLCLDLVWATAASDNPWHLKNNITLLKKFYSDVYFVWEALRNLLLSWWDVTLLFWNRIFSTIYRGKVWLLTVYYFCFGWLMVFEVFFNSSFGKVSW